MQSSVRPRLSPPPNAWFAALITFICSALVASLIVARIQQASILEERARVSAQATSYAHAMEEDLRHSMAAALALATFVRSSGGVPDHFEEIARDMLELYPGISMLSLSPGGIVSEIMPVEGNEAVLGLNQLTDADQRGETIRARDSGQLTIAGPLELLQGGIGIVGRYPIFLTGPEGGTHFWGFANVTRRIGNVLRAGRLDELRQQGLMYQLWRIHPDTGERQEIAGSNQREMFDPVQALMELPNDTWVLSVEPYQGWYSLRELLALIAVGALVSLLLAYLAKLLVELHRHKQSLEQEVRARTQVVRETQQHLDSVINAIPDMLFEVDLEGRYLTFFSHDPSMLEKPFEQIRGKTVAELLPPEAAETVLDTLQEAATKGYSTGNQFSVMHKGNPRYYELSAARKPGAGGEGTHFIVLSRNITARKQAEIDARTSLERYRSLVAASNTGAWEYFHKKDFLHCSPEYFSMLGRDIRHYDMSGESNLQQTWLDLIHPDDCEQANTRFRDYIIQQTDGMYENRYRMLHANGHWVWILSRGRALCDDTGAHTGMTAGTHIDITNQVENETKLQLAARVFERGSEGFIITDANENIVMVNQAFTRITGYSEAEALGQQPRMLASGRHDTEFYGEMWQQLNSEGQWQGEIWNRRKDGTTYPQWLSISTLTDDEGTVVNYIGIISDITQLKEDQDEIHRLAYYDVLTGLPNRSLLEERAQYALGMAQRNQTPLAMMFFDLDNFKNINDSLGHRAGDSLLINFSRRISQTLREGDTFSRPGGDEFILLLPDTDANGAAHTAQKILALLEQPFDIEGYDLSVTSSIGIAMFPNDGRELGKLYTNADIAMYRAKENGRNTYSFFTPELQTHYVRTLQLENAMRRALEFNQFELHYQPQRDINSGVIIGLEALLRWRHPELGSISPAEFIPIAETSGMILPIGEWVMREAAQQLQDWIEAGIAPPKMAINLSAVQLRQPNLPDRLLSILKEVKLPEEYFEMELTESVAMSDPAQASKLIERLHRAGISISIDDFGTGYSSLSYLKRFKIYKLKIDQSFVRDLTDDAEDLEIVRAIINLAKTLGLRTIAEGVETPEQLAILKKLECDDLQGYLFSPPMNAADTEKFLRSHQNNA